MYAGGAEGAAPGAVIEEAQRVSRPITALSFLTITAFLFHTMTALLFLIIIPILKSEFRNKTVVTRRGNRSFANFCLVPCGGEGLSCVSSTYLCVFLTTIVTPPQPPTPLPYGWLSGSCVEVVVVWRRWLCEVVVEVRSLWMHIYR